ncbi:MAG: hypothetical protein IKS83_04090, partial [Victivallales bacterium]|nr:hypothetical protein [Victivallales bacterium]
TVSAIRRIRDLTGIDFGNAKVFADQGTMEKIGLDVVLLAEVLYAALLPAITQKGIEKDDFCDAIQGDAINEAQFALLDGIADFFPKAQGNLLKSVLRQAREEQEKAVKEMEETLMPAQQPSSSQG